VLYVLSFDVGRLLEMDQASPQAIPIVDIDQLRAAALDALDLPAPGAASTPTLVSSLPPGPRAPDLEALVPTEVSGRTMTVYGSWATLEGGADWFTFPAAMIARQTGRSLADASAVLAAPADNQGQPLTVIQFKGLRGDDMLVDFLADWEVAWTQGSLAVIGRDVDGHRLLASGTWAAFADADALYFVEIPYGATGGPAPIDFAADVIGSLP
jgi:hypothetical protein